MKPIMWSKMCFLIFFLLILCVPAFYSNDEEDNDNADIDVDVDEDSDEVDEEEAVDGGDNDYIE